MNQQTMEKMGESLKLSFIAGRALIALSRVEKGQPVNAVFYRKALDTAASFMRSVNSGRDVFKGNSLSGSALYACTAYDVALRAMKSRAQSVLSKHSLEDFFADIEKHLEDLLNSKPVKPDQITQSKAFFSWLMKSTGDETRQVLESKANVELPEWLNKGA